MSGSTHDIRFDKVRNGPEGIRTGIHEFTFLSQEAMIKTIRTWIYRIQNYEDQMEKLEKVSAKLRKAQAVCEQDALERIKSQNEMKRLVSLLSGNTWQEGDNMMEAIEAFQQTKYLKEHKEDIILIFKGNMDDPEEAARQILEYFEIEVKEEMQRGKVKFIYE